MTIAEQRRNSYGAAGVDDVVATSRERQIVCDTYVSRTCTMEASMRNLNPACKSRGTKMPSTATKPFNKQATHPISVALIITNEGEVAELGW